jgi:sialic acid synthase SpsE
MIILDLGNGSVCKNDRGLIKDMIDSVAEVDRDRQCIIKWQLFLAIPPKEPLRRDNFHYAYDYAAALGFYTTASVFDNDSLDFLLRYQIPFVKIANQPFARKYIPDVLGHIQWVDGQATRPKIIVSYGDSEQILKTQLPYMCCVSEYPARMEDYEKRFEPDSLRHGISDHTDHIKLYRKYHPKIYEKHYTLDHVSTDAPRPYALRQKDLNELLHPKAYEMYEGYGA